MFDTLITPSIAVTIGKDTRLYCSLVTTAPAELDPPATITLYAATLADVAGLAADPISFDATERNTPGRLILVDALEFAWLRARCRGNHHRLVRADPGLVGLNTLQHWLWQRLQAGAGSQVAA